MHGNADGARLVRYGAGDCLPNPPRRIGGKLEALGVVELLHRFHKAEVALLDEVEELHSASHIALGDGNDEAQVRLGKSALRFRVALLHTFCQLHLFLGRQKGHFAYIFEVHLDGVVEIALDDGVDVVFL